jgi:hypothetical protein
VFASRFLLDNPYFILLRPMFLNRALGSATSVNLTSGSVDFTDSVTASQADVFKFNLAQRSSVNLLVAGLSGDVNIAIVQDKQAAGVAGFGVVNEGEILGSSALTWLQGIIMSSLQVYRTRIIA